MKTVAIITAAGCGKRMGGPKPRHLRRRGKQFLDIGGKPMLEWTISVFENCEAVDEIILVVNQEDLRRGKQFKFSKLKKVVAGGKHRQDSVYNGLKALPEDAERVAIHDGARPLVTEEEIKRAVKEAERSKAVVVGVPVKDTIKKIKDHRQRRSAEAEKSKIKDNVKVIETVNREELWVAQTPQVFEKEIILRAYQEGCGKYQVTDDAMLVEKLGVPVKMVMGSYRNMKITTPEDLKIAEAILRKE